MKMLSALVRAFVGTSLALSVISMPVSAGIATASTWHVAPTGSGGGSCTSPDFNSVSAAVAAAGRDDTILVCPGNYTDRIRINGAGKDGLTIRAAVPFKARFWAPTGGGAFDVMISLTNVNRVRIEYLTFLARGSMPCEPMSTVIRVVGKSRLTRITGNRFRVSGASTKFRAPCGYAEAIGDEALAGGGTVIFGNMARDFGDTAIVSDAPSPRIYRNVIRYLHTDYSAAPTGIGIDVNSSVHAVIRGNDIRGLASSGLASGTPLLDIGIISQFASGASVKDNVVRYASRGLIVGGGFDDYVLRNRILQSRSVGLKLLALGNSVVRHNTSLGSGTWDCQDDSPSAPNIWSNDIGRTSSPVGLCTPPAP